MQLTILRTPARTTTDLIAFAETRGLAVHWALDLPERGRYIPGRRIIVVRHGMTRRRTHATLAHEIAHDFWYDQGSCQRVEARAWQCASLILIHPCDYARAEQLHPSAGALAHELAVTTEVIEAYRRLLAAGSPLIADIAELAS